MSIVKINVKHGRVILSNSIEELYSISIEYNVYRIDGKPEEVLISSGLINSNDILTINLTLITDWCINDILQSEPSSILNKWLELTSNYFVPVDDSPQANGDNWLGKVSKNKIIGHEIWDCLGERDNIGLTESGEDITRMNELTPPPTSHILVPTPNPAGEQMSVVSESVNDTIAGTNVQKIRIHYIKASDGLSYTEDIEMNGTTAVDLVTSDPIFINDIYSIQCGINRFSDQHIKIFKKSDPGLVYNMIASGGNKSLVPHRMIPNGYTGIIQTWHASEGNNKRAAIRLRSTDMYGVLLPDIFCFKNTTYLNGTSSPELDVRIRIPSLSIVKISSWAVASQGECSVGYIMEVIDNRFL